MAGRKPKPTAVKKLEGNPGKRKLNTKEPNPGKGMPDCPAWLLPEAKTEWIRLSEKLNQMGVLTEIDRSAFAAYCQSYARWKEAQEHINSEGATYETENGMQRPNPWVAICNTEQRLMMQAARVRTDSISQVRLVFVEEQLMRSGFSFHQFKRTNDNICRLLNAIRDLDEWMKDAKERVHRIEDPTISNMVMTYYEHRDEIAKGYERGTKKAQLGNLQYVSKVQVYIEQNNLTTIDDVERVICEKNDLLKQAKDGLDNKKSELKRIKKNLSLIDDYYENKPVYDEPSFEACNNFEKGEFEI